MLKKEVNELSRQSTYFIISVVLGTFLVLEGFALIRSFPAYAELLLPVYQLGLLIFSLFLGISLFASDMRDGGMEYLLSLPYSRLQLLAYKVVPRAAVLLLCYVLYLLLTAVLVRGLDMQWFTPPVLFYLCVSLFVIGASFSVFQGSFIIAGLATAFVFFVYLGIVRFLYPLVEQIKTESLEGFRDLIYGSAWWKIPGSVYFAGFILLAAFASAFVYAFKRFELGSPRNFTRRYLKVFIPIIVVGLVVSWIWAYREISGGYKYYTLTPNNRLVEYDYPVSRVYLEKKVNKLEQGSFYPFSFVEKNGYFYTYKYGRFFAEIIRIDPVNNTYDTWYRADGYDMFSYAVYGFKDTIAVIECEFKGGTRLLTLIDTGTKSFKQIKVAENLKRWNSYYPRVFGAGETEGKRFWLLYGGSKDGWDVQAAWEDGRVETQGVSRAIPVYVNGMLITLENKQLVFKRITPAGTEVIDTKPVPVEGWYHFRGASTNNFDRLPAAELYGVVTEDREDIYRNKSKKVLRVDLQTLEITEVKALEDQRGKIVYCHPDTWYYIKQEYGPADAAAEEPILKALYRLKQGNLELVREFEPMNIGYKESENYFGVYDTGFVLKKNGKISVYGLPGLQPIPFEELE